jgi:hypothetical protein
VKHSQSIVTQIFCEMPKIATELFLETQPINHFDNCPKSPSLSAYMMTQLSMKLRDFDILPPYMTSGFNTEAHDEISDSERHSDSDDTNVVSPRSNEPDSTSEASFVSDKDFFRADTRVSLELLSTAETDLNHNHHNSTSPAGSKTHLRIDTQKSFCTFPDGVPVHLDYSLHWVPAGMHPTLCPAQYAQLLERIKTKPVSTLTRSRSVANRSHKFVRAHKKSSSDGSEALKSPLANESLSLFKSDDNDKPTLKRSVRTKTRRRQKDLASFTSKKSIIPKPKRHSSLSRTSFVKAILEAAANSRPPLAITSQNQKTPEGSSFERPPRTSSKSKKDSAVVAKRKSLVTMMWSVVAFTKSKSDEEKNFEEMIQNATTKRAVFLMSHQKISSPRPLVQQVLISNLMYKVIGDKEMSILNPSTDSIATLTMERIPKPGQMPVRSASSKGKAKRRRRPRSNSTALSPGQLLQPVKKTLSGEAAKSPQITNSDEDDDDSFIVERRRKDDEEEVELDDEKPLGLVFSKAVLAN